MRARSAPPARRAASPMRQVHASYGVAHRKDAAKTGPSTEQTMVDMHEARQSQQRAKLQIPGTQDRNALFDRMDVNGNGGLSLAEIDKAVVELWPAFNHKAALMRAYRAADRNNDGYITRKEFGNLLESIRYFNELWCAACLCIILFSVTFRLSRRWF